MKKSITQITIEYLWYIFPIILIIYSGIDGFSSALDFLTVTKSITISIIIFIFWASTKIYLSRYRLSWIVDGKRLYISRPKRKFDLVLFVSLLSVWIPHLFNAMSYYPNESEDYETTEIQALLNCDRDKEIGCSLDFQPRGLYRFPTFSILDNSSFEVEYGIVNVACGLFNQSYAILTSAKDNKKYKFDPEIEYYENTEFIGSELNFPRNDSLNISDGPYVIKVDSSGKLAFEGKIHDIKNEELLGWFSDNEFGVVKPCAFSWNKDKYGIEIIDKYGYVCFSMTIEEDFNYRFKGFYKQNDSYIIYNDSVRITSDFSDAIELIKLIDPIFDHFGTDILGKRL